MRALKNPAITVKITGLIVLKRVPLVLSFALLAAILPGCGPETTSRPAPPADAEWRRIGSWSGHGNAQLETFPIGGWTWRVQWETRNENPPGAGTFRASAHSGDSGRQLAEIANVRGIDHDTTYITELPHRYYLVVASENVDWSMTVEEAMIK